MPQSPQAVLPETRTWPDYIRDQVLAQPLVVDPPNIVTANGQVWPETEGVAIRVLHNVGTLPVKYAIGSADASDAVFHDVLRADTAQDAGNGAQVDLSRFKGRVTIFGVGGNPRVATFRAHGPERFVQ